MNIEKNEKKNNQKEFTENERKHRNKMPTENMVMEFDESLTKCSGYGHRITVKLNSRHRHSCDTAFKPQFHFHFHFSFNA